MSLLHHNSEGLGKEVKSDNRKQLSMSNELKDKHTSTNTVPAR